jgi:hypothetical protein
MMSRPLTSRPWTKAEVCLLRERYATEGAKAIALELGRTWRSVTMRAKRLQLVHVRRWTWKDDDQLRIDWGIHPMEHIAKTLNRTTYGVYCRAQALGLGVGCPQGFEYLSAASRRTGYAVSSLRRILSWAHVPIRRAYAKPDRPPSRCPNWIVEPIAVDDAVAEWHQTEPLDCAAERHGVAYTVLIRLLGDAAMNCDQRVCSLVLNRFPNGAANRSTDAPPRRSRRHWRIPSALADEFLSAYKRREIVFYAARRVGVTPQTLALWLRAAGVRFSRCKGVDPAEVDRIVAEKRAAGCHAWRQRRAA